MMKELLVRTSRRSTLYRQLSGALALSIALLPSVYTAPLDVSDKEIIALSGKTPVLIIDAYRCDGPYSLFIYESTHFVISQSAETRIPEVIYKRLSVDDYRRLISAIERFYVERDTKWNLPRDSYAIDGPCFYKIMYRKGTLYEVVYGDMSRSGIPDLIREVTAFPTLLDALLPPYAKQK